MKRNKIKQKRKNRIKLIFASKKGAVGEATG